MSGIIQRQYLELLSELNRKHAEKRPVNWSCRRGLRILNSLRRCNFSAEDATDLTQESKETRQMYGLEDEATREFGERCLIARRLIERGVRFVQLLPRISIGIIMADRQKPLPNSCRKIDQPAAALVRI